MRRPSCIISKPPLLLEEPPKPEVPQKNLFNVYVRQRTNWEENRPKQPIKPELKKLDEQDPHVLIYNFKNRAEKLIQKQLKAKVQEKMTELEVKKNINKLIKENNEAYVEKCRDCNRDKEFCPCVDLNSFLKPKTIWKPSFAFKT